MHTLHGSCPAAERLRRGTKLFPQMGYKEIKSMVVDILKTDEGRKAVEDALSGGSGEELVVLPAADP